MSYIGMELTCAGIPEEKLEAEPFTVDQENVLQQLDAGSELPVTLVLRQAQPTLGGLTVSMTLDFLFK